MCERQQEKMCSVCAQFNSLDQQFCCASTNTFMPSKLISFSALSSPAR